MQTKEAEELARFSDQELRDQIEDLERRWRMWDRKSDPALEYAARQEDINAELKIIRSELERRAGNKSVSDPLSQDT